MSSDVSAAVEEEQLSNPRLAILLAMAMFVLVVDTSLMNVSISAVVKDLDTTASGVQSAIAIEALVSAAFILISSKVGDLIGRKRAYVLVCSAMRRGPGHGAVAEPPPVIIFWAIFGGLGASLLLPSMQSLIHGNFQGSGAEKVYALVGASSAIAAAIGPLSAASSRPTCRGASAFCSRWSSSPSCCRDRLVKDVPYTGERGIDVVGAMLSVLGMGGDRPGHPGLAGGRRLRSACSWPSAHSRLRRSHSGSDGASAESKLTLLDPDLFSSPQFRLGYLRPDAAADRAGRHNDRAADLSADGAGVQRPGGGPVDRTAVPEHVRGRTGGRAPGRQATGRGHHPGGLRARARQEC